MFFLILHYGHVETNTYNNIIHDNNYDQLGYLRNIGFWILIFPKEDRIYKIKKVVWKQRIRPILTRIYYSRPNSAHLIVNAIACKPTIAPDFWKFNSYCL